MANAARQTDARTSPGRVDVGESLSHGVGELGPGLIGDCPQQVLAVGEMAIGGVVGDADPSRGFSQNERVGSALARQGHGRFEQPFAQ